MELQYPLTSNVLTHIVCEARAIKRIVRESASINTTQYRLLLLPMRINEPQRPSQIAQSLRLTRSAVSDSLGDLERRGFLVREASTTDRRERLVAITTEGRDAAATAEAAVQHHVTELWKPLSKKPRETILGGIVSNDRTPKPQEPLQNICAASLNIEDFLFVHGLAVETARPPGLSLTAFRVLFELGQHPGSLEQFQLVRRTEHPPTNQRANALAILPAGSALLEAHAPSVDRALMDGSYATSEQERRTTASSRTSWWSACTAMRRCMGRASDRKERADKMLEIGHHTVILGNEPAVQRRNGFMEAGEDLDCRVINQDFEPIPGLYAAGEVAGGTHGAVRLGSCAITDCVVFGRIASQRAAAEQPWE